MRIWGYKYNSEIEAMEAIRIANEHKGLPNEHTQNWVMYKFSEIDNIYYIHHVGGVEEVLGDPNFVSLTVPEFNK